MDAADKKLMRRLVADYMQGAGCGGVRRISRTLQHRYWQFTLQKVR